MVAAPAGPRQASTDVENPRQKRLANLQTGTAVLSRDAAKAAYEAAVAKRIRDEEEQEYQRERQARELERQRAAEKVLLHVLAPRT